MILELDLCPAVPGSQQHLKVSESPPVLLQVALEWRKSTEASPRMSGSFLRYFRDQSSSKVCWQRHPSNLSAIGLAAAMTSGQGADPSSGRGALAFSRALVSPTAMAPSHICASWSS